ncbi:MAG: hypothetical protein HC882_05615 [Acidobacteria bacterium]|nr:hypothetical protein [Acidobacteriota bacterium]
MAPVSMESNKKGFFIFPRLELLNDGYEMSVEKEGWFVRSFEIRTRRGTREIWQEDKGQLVPTAQKFPPVRYRGANATVLLVMQTIDEYRAQRQAEAQGEATKQAAEEDSVARPQAKQGATLTIADQGREALALGDLAAQLAVGALLAFGALANLLLQQDVRFEERVSATREVDGAFDALHQHAVDLLELRKTRFERFAFVRLHARAAPARRVATHVASLPSASPTKVWLMCTALYCSP